MEAAKYRSRHDPTETLDRAMGWSVLALNRGVTPEIKRAFKRRAAVEPVIG